MLNRRMIDMKVLENALKYIHQREYDGGGFTLYEGIPDGKNTYYGLSVLNLLGETPNNIDKTIYWLKNLQNSRVFGIYGKFNLLNSLVLLGKEPEIPDKYIHPLLEKKKFPNLEIAFLTTAILKLIGYHDFNHISEWILRQQNDDGGFNIGGSDIQSTYYAVESLNCIDESLIENRDNILDFTKRCRTKEGLFVYTPISYPPYIESIYSGVKIFETLGKIPENKESMVDFVLELQNNDGGFRRSIYMGISELEYTYRALYVLKTLSYL